MKDFLCLSMLHGPKHKIQVWSSDEAVVLSNLLFFNTYSRLKIQKLYSSGSLNNQSVKGGSKCLK